MLSDRAATLTVEDLQVRGMMDSARGTVELPGTHVRQKAGLNRSIQSAFVTPCPKISETSGDDTVQQVRPSPDLAIPANWKGKGGTPADGM